MAKGAAQRARSAGGAATERGSKKNRVMRVFLAVAAVGTLFSAGYTIGRGRPAQPSLSGGVAAQPPAGGALSSAGEEGMASPAKQQRDDDGPGEPENKAVPAEFGEENVKKGEKASKRRRGKREKRAWASLQRAQGLLRGGADASSLDGDDAQKNSRPVSFYAGGSVNASIVAPAFWVPTELAHVEHGDPRVTLCKLDVDAYWRNPTKTPMFRDLVSASRCARGRSGSLNELYKEAMNREKQPLKPSGFVFHESRVGSTLIANMLASVPTNLVYSESSPPPSIINHCRGCTSERRSDLLQKLVALMGASPFHEHLFFKFQSITVPNIAVLSDAFPDTPWIFVYREPVQVMMSHFKRGLGGAGSGAPCLREHRRPRAETARILRDASPDSTVDASRVPPERYCAAHLAMLCESALANDRAAGSKALMVNYDSLPGSLVHYVLPRHFGLTGVYDDHAKRRMLDVANVYSKRRKALPAGDAAADGKPIDEASKAKWGGDSAAKEKAASPKIKQAAEDLMRPRYEALLRATTLKTDGDDLLSYKHRQVDADLLLEP